MALVNHSRYQRLHQSSAATWKNYTDFAGNYWVDRTLESRAHHFLLRRCQRNHSTSSQTSRLLVADHPYLLMLLKLKLTVFSSKRACCDASLGWSLESVFCKSLFLIFCPSSSALCFSLPQLSVLLARAAAWPLRY